MTILFAWLLADFFSGLVHWAQDRLLLKPSRWSVLNSIKLDNDLHHRSPFAMTKLTYWQNINTSAMFAWPLCAILILCGCPTLIWLTLFFASFANLVHRFAHIKKMDRPWFINFLQWTGLFISFQHHYHHHFDEEGIVEKQNSTGRYCPMTSLLNPVLDWVGFFKFLEFLLTL